MKNLVVLRVALWFVVPAAIAVEAREITESVTFEKEEGVESPLVIRTSGIVIDGNGATIRGAGQQNDLKSFQGNGLTIEGARNVTVRNLKVQGFRIGVRLIDCENLSFENCNFSDNYHEPTHGWGDGSRVGGVIMDRTHGSVFRNVTAGRNWNGFDLLKCDRNTVMECDLSHCSNVGLKLETSSHNIFRRNDISYGIRISPGEVHARDSTGVLLESGSNNNLFENNDMTHGGNGFFIRVLNGWVSTGNVLIGNDASHANNNGFESWSPGNVYLNNIANACSYGFWLGGSDETVLIGNEAGYNGRSDRGGRANAPESDFRHGGIVIVNGSGTHTLIEGNHVHNNNGGGIVFRGDRASKGKLWPFHHVLVQNNRIENNEWGLFTRFADSVTFAGNSFEGNQHDFFIEEVQRIQPTPGLRHADQQLAGGGRPRVTLEVSGPEVRRLRREGRNHDYDFGADYAVTLGSTMTFSVRPHPGKRPGDSVEVNQPTHHRFAIVGPEWELGRSEGASRSISHSFDSPGFHRVSYTGWNDQGAATIAWANVSVVEPDELPATESLISGFTILPSGANPGNSPSAAVSSDRDHVLVGGASARFSVNQHNGNPVEIRLQPPGGFDLSGKKQIRFWMRARNENISGFEASSPIVRITSGESTYTYLPVRNGGPANLFFAQTQSEAREGWLPVAIDLAGSDSWARIETREGEIPPFYNNGLGFVTSTTPLATQSDSAMTTDGQFLYLATVEGDHLVRSRDGLDWDFLPNPRQELGAQGQWGNGMLVYAPKAGEKGSLILRYQSTGTDKKGNHPGRLVLFDLAENRWSWHPTNTTMVLGATVAGDHVYGIARARMSNFGGPLDRVDLTQQASFSERTNAAGVPGPSPQWFGWASQLATVNGRIFAIKNDNISPQPKDPLEIGDRLLSFDPNRFVNGTVPEGRYWDGMNVWKPGWTEVEDHGPLPFEIGSGASLVGVPAHWSKNVGSEGGIFVVAAGSPADYEGRGSPSTHYAIYDVASGSWTEGRLPVATGTGTSMTFMDRKVFINRGGMNFVPSNRQLWIVSPSDRVDSDLTKNAFDFSKVDRISFDFQSRGTRPFELWVDGLKIE